MAAELTFDLRSFYPTTMTDCLPSTREMKVLRGLCLGNVEAETYFAFAGRKTFDELFAKGWIERAHDETYDTNGWRITPAGEVAYNAGYDAGL
jgi:hypothetical protein